VTGTAYNACGVVVGAAEVDFNILDRNDVHVESVMALTRNLDTGSTWMFKTNATDAISDDRGPVHFKLVKAVAYK